MVASLRPRVLRRVEPAVELLELWLAQDGRIGGTGPSSCCEVWRHVEP